MTEHEKLARKSKLQYGTFSFPLAFFQDDMESYKNGIMDWHWHPEIEFILVLAGTVKCNIGDSEILLQRGNGAFINQNTLHRFEVEKTGKLLSLIFSPHFMAAPSSALFLSYVAPILNSNLYFLPLSSTIAWQEWILKKIYDTACYIKKKDALWEWDACIAILEIWRKFYFFVSEQCTTDTKPRFFRIQKRVQEMMFFIEQNFSEKLTVSKIAASANISESEASRCFKELIHSSPIQYLNEYRLSVSAKLLCTTEYSVAHIANIVGFENAAYFDRLFRRKFHQTPFQLRKTNHTESSTVNKDKDQSPPWKQ